MIYPGIWNSETGTLGARKGERYRVICTGNGVTLIEFADGFRVVTPRPV